MSATEQPGSAPPGPEPEPSGSDWVFQGGGEAGDLMRSVDWASMPLGPSGAWPRSLRTVANLVLHTRYPMFAAWGPDLTFLYNDAYTPILGEKHPAMGRPFQAIWHEIWPAIGPLVEAALAGESTWSEDLFLCMERHGYREECYFTFSYSPLRGAAGRVEGMMCACTETTRPVLDKRRIETLRRLGQAAVEARTVAAADALCADALEGNGEDLPFALLYRHGADGWRRAAAGGHLPATAEDAGAWPLEILQVEEVRRVELDVATAPPSAWADDPVRQAVVLPVPGGGGGTEPAALVLGVNPLRPLDGPYLDFLGHVAGSFATAAANGRAYEKERERAEALAELDRAKTAFFGNVSHEFRTPLTLTLGPLEEALGEDAPPLDPGQRGRLELAYRNTRRLLRLVNTLLDFSRIEAGRIQAAYAPTDLAAATRDLASMFRSAMERAGLRYTLDVEPLAEPVWVDGEMWEKIVMNLLSNAFKYTLEGEVEVRLGVADGHAELSVRDTGVGIPEAERGRLFERFHRVEGTGARSQEGSGIGLALVQELVRLHGGIVEVESAPGVGSRFTVRIPLGHEHLPPDHVRPHAAVAVPAVAGSPWVEEALRWLPDGEEAPLTTPGGDAAPHATPGPAQIGDAHVLVVDDNADMRDYLRRLLETRWRVTTVRDGRSGLEAVRSTGPDLVLTDVMLPGLDGFGLLAALRSDPETERIPVIMLSARAGEEARVEGMAAGADDYMVKPFTARELVARVWAHLELARVRDAARLRESEARRAAEDAVEARSQFMANISHELRTPLNAVIGYLDLLLEGLGGDLTDTQRRHLNRSRAGATHLKELIEEILTFSRIEAGDEELETEEVAVGAAVIEVAELVEPLLREKGLALTVRVAEPDPVVATDPGKLRQIVLNLLSNAHKYTDEGKVEVVVGLADDEVRVSVRDTGWGIGGEDRERVFEAFRRLPATLHKGGTGLGLNVSRSLADLLGGRITLESEIGEGSVFTLALPVARRGRVGTAPLTTGSAPRSPGPPEAGDGAPAPPAAPPPVAPPPAPPPPS